MCLLSTPSNFLLSLSFYHKKEPKRFNTYHNIEKKEKKQTYYETQKYNP